MKLNQGVNQIRVNASSSDGSWEAVPAEIALSCSRRLARSSRLFVVAVGISDYAQAELKLHHLRADARAIADLLQCKAAALYGRVDVIPLAGRDATSARIKETLSDVAALSEPHDTIALVLFGQGTLFGERFYFAPQDLRLGKAVREQVLRTQGLAVEELTAILGTAGAQKRVLILDASYEAFLDTRKKQMNFSLRGVVERGRAHKESTSSLLSRRYARPRSKKPHRACSLGSSWTRWKQTTMICSPIRETPWT